jgi:hypothetical protein
MRMGTSLYGASPSQSPERRQELKARVNRKTNISIFEWENLKKQIYKYRYLSKEPPDLGVRRV